MPPGKPTSGSRRSQVSEGCKNKECSSSAGGTRSAPELTSENGFLGGLRARLGPGMARNLGHLDVLASDTSAAALYERPGLAVAGCAGAEGGCTTCSGAGSETVPGSTSSPSSKPRSRRSAAEVRQGNGRLGTPPGRRGPSGPGDPRRTRSRAVDGQRARLHTTLGELRRLLHEATGDPDSLHLALHHTQKAVEASRSGQWP